MAAPKLIATRDVALDEIVMEKRLRRVTTSAVDAIVASLETTGAMIAPVSVRQKDGKLILMTGAHRLAAMRKMGRETVRAEIWRCTDQIARFFEVHENLASAELSPLELGQFLHEAKDAYETLHPTTKAGVINNLSRWGNDLTGTVPFTAAMAEKRGVSRSLIEKLVRVGKNIDPAAAEILQKRKDQANYRELLAICAEDPSVQRRAAIVLEAGKAQTLIAAISAVKGAPQGDKPSDPVEDARSRLVLAWSKAPKEARRRFLEGLKEIAPDAALVAEVFGK